MTPTKMAGQFGDTTYTKVFVGGLAWETQTETMKKYFDQFGEILEAVVITDKNSGRSKGYGFVTFRDPEAATRACVDASPVIDGRRANCNLASLGVYKSKPTIPQHVGGRNLRTTKSFNSVVQGGGGAAFPSPAGLPYYAVQQYVYGYSPYSAEYAYPASYYNMYGGAAAPYPVYGGGAGVVSGAATSFYPYVQLGQGGYSVPLPSLVQYSGVASTSGFTGFRHPFGGTISIPPSPPSQTGLTMGLTSPSLPSPTPHHYTIIPSQSIQSTASEQPLA